jgi:hypothetical protein
LNHLGNAFDSGDSRVELIFDHLASGAGRCLLLARLCGFRRKQRIELGTLHRIDGNLPAIGQAHRGESYLGEMQRREVSAHHRLGALPCWNAPQPGNGAEYLGPCWNHFAIESV